MSFLHSVGVAVVWSHHIEAHTWQIKSDKHLWCWNVYFVGLEEVWSYLMASSYGVLKLLCFFFFVFFFLTVGGLLPLPTKPLSDCWAVMRSPITTGNSGFQVPVYSAHAATLQRLVITICSGLYILSLGLSLFSFTVFSLSFHSSSIYWIHISFPQSLSTPSFPATSHGSSSFSASLFELSSMPRSCRIPLEPNAIVSNLVRSACVCVCVSLYFVKLVRALFHTATSNWWLLLSDKLLDQNGFRRILQYILVWWCFVRGLFYSKMLTYPKCTSK